MKLIIIRGRQNDGKTTTSSILHNQLVERGAKVKLLQTNGNYLSVCNWMVDFQSVLDLGKRRIVIISEGDDDDRLAELMDELINEYRPDIVVVCARARDIEGSSYRMLTQKYKDLIEPRNVFWTEYTDDNSKINEVKSLVVEKIINRIQSI